MNSSQENHFAQPGQESPFREASPSGLRLAVVGVGALGSELCLRLAESTQEISLAEVLLVDHGQLELQNIPVGRLYRSIPAQSIGLFKADLVAALLNTGSAPRWIACPVEIADVGWQLLSACDLLICCADNTLARIETALVARHLQLPMLDAGILGEGLPSGRIAWFPPAPDCACSLCGIGEKRRAELLAYGLSATLGCVAPEQPQPFSEIPTAHPAVRETVTAALHVIADFASSPSASALLGSAAGAKRLLAHDPEGQHWTGEIIHLPRSLSCPWHAFGTSTLLPLSPDLPLRDSIPLEEPGQPPWRIRFAWPICVDARCRACGLRQSPRQRLALVRRRGICIQCREAAMLDPILCIGSLTRTDALARDTPRQLGLPDRHLALLRPTLRTSERHAR